MLTARLQHLGLSAGDRVLDLGCGEGRHVHGLYMIGGLEIDGIDLDAEALEKAEVGLSSLPPPRGSDDGVARFAEDRFSTGRFDTVLDVVGTLDVVDHLASRNLNQQVAGEGKQQVIGRSFGAGFIDDTNAIGIPIESKTANVIAIGDLVAQSLHVLRYFGIRKMIGEG